MRVMREDERRLELPDQVYDFSDLPAIHLQWAVLVIQIPDVLDTKDLASPSDFVFFHPLDFVK